MLENKKARFNIIYVPEKINGKENIDKKSVCRSGLLDDKTKVFTTTKGEIAVCYFDVDRNNYRTAKNKWTINIRG
jgi:hypothetical protein